MRIKDPASDSVYINEPPYVVGRDSVVFRKLAAIENRRKGGCTREARGLPPLPDPHELAAFLVDHGYDEAKVKYRIGQATVRKILIDAGLPTPAPGRLLSGGKRKAPGPPKAEYDTADLIAYLEAGNFLRQAMRHFHTSMNTIKPKLREAGRLDLLDGGRLRAHRKENVTPRTAREYQSKKDFTAYTRRENTKQPFRNPSCRFYDRCLDAVKNQRLGMDCTGCKRFTLEQPVDPVQTVGSHRMIHSIGRM